MRKCYNDLWIPHTHTKLHDKINFCCSFTSQLQLHSSRHSSNTQTRAQTSESGCYEMVLPSVKHCIDFHFVRSSLYTRRVGFIIHRWVYFIVGSCVTPTLHEMATINAANPLLPVEINDILFFFFFLGTFLCIFCCFQLRRVILLWFQQRKNYEQNFNTKEFTEKWPSEHTGHSRNIPLFMTSANLMI